MTGKDETSVGEVGENFTPTTPEPTKRAAIQRDAKEGETRCWVSFFLPDNVQAGFKQMLKLKGLKQYDWLRDIVTEKVTSEVQRFEAEELPALRDKEAAEIQAKLEAKKKKQEAKAVDAETAEARAQREEARAAASNARKGGAKKTTEPEAPVTEAEIEAAMNSLGIAAEPELAATV